MKLKIKINDDFKLLYTKEIDKYRELIYYGGRGGAKTYEIKQFLSIKALTEKCNILCLREFARTNKHSLVAEFREFFATYDFETILKEYVVTIKGENAIKIGITEISFKHNGSKIVFMGINDNTVLSLKSVSKINYCWVEEASFITEYAYNILKPTIREENSKIFFTFNPLNKDDFIYKKVLNNTSDRVFIKKVNYDSNAFFPKVLELDRIDDFKHKPRDYYNHIWLGAPLEYNDCQVINTDLIGYFDDDLKINYDETFITADTAYSKNESADFSVVGCFAVKDEQIFLLRIFRGKWDFNELQNILLSAYEWVSVNHRPPEKVLIEKKASGISLLQELRRVTNLPLKEVVPKTDKFSRVCDVLNELPRLRLPMNKLNPLNSWVDDFLYECRMFRSDIQHLHDDQVDVLCYALQYCKKNKVDWNLLAELSKPAEL